MVESSFSVRNWRLVALAPKPHALERIDLHPFVVKCQCYDSLQYLAVLVCSILFLLFINAEEKVKVADKGIVDGGERDVSCVIALTDELTEITFGSLVAKNSVEYDITDFKTLTILRVVLFEYFAQQFGLLNPAVPFVKNGLRVDKLLLIGKTLMNLEKSRQCIVEIVVQFKRQAVATSGTLFFSFHTFGFTPRLRDASRKRPSTVTRIYTGASPFFNSFYLLM